MERIFKDNGWRVRDHDSSDPTRIGTPNSLRTCPPQHWEGGLLRQIYNLSEIHVKFLFVRNPINRLLSEYRWRNSASQIRTHRARLRHFVNWWESTRLGYASNPRILENHIRPQVDFLVEDAVIGKFETDLTDDFIRSLLPSREASKWETVMKRSNASASFQLDLPPSVLAEVTEFYVADFERFSY